MVARPNHFTIVEQPESRKRLARSFSVFFVVSVVAIVFLPLLLSFYEYPVIKTTLALVLLVICFYPGVRYYAYAESGLPAFPVFCLAYALQFALPIFTRVPGILLVGNYFQELSEEVVNRALLHSILGVLAMQLGYYGTVVNNWLKKSKPFELEVDDAKAKVYCVLAALFIPLLNYYWATSNAYSQFSQFGAIIRVIQTQILVAIAILTILILTGRASKLFYFVVYGSVALAVLQGISAGGMEPAIVPIATLLMARWQVTKRVPIAPVAIALLLIIFLSPVKADYRRDVWFGANQRVAESTSQVERSLYWFEQATEYWGKTLRGEKSIAESTEQSSSRLDLIHQFAHVCSLTPEVVPFQYGNTYSYFLVSFIPRFIWLDKPEAGYANRFFAVSYNITTEEGATRSTFGFSLLAESYVNFGLIGIILIMMLQGIVLGLLYHFFGSSRAGVGAQAIFIAFFVYFLNGVGTSAEILFGNIIQLLIFNCFLLLLIRARHPDAGANQIAVGGIKGTL